MTTISKEPFSIKNGDVTLHGVVSFPTTMTRKEEEEDELQRTVDIVILLHGGPGLPDEFKYVTQKLLQQQEQRKTSKYYYVVNFDQRGMGMSTNPSKDYSMEGYISDINAIMSYFTNDDQGGKQLILGTTSSTNDGNTNAGGGGGDGDSERIQFHLFGHSWGGLYAQIYADAHPERIHSMFLCSPAPGTNQCWAQTEKEIMSFHQQRSTFWELAQMSWYSLIGMMFQSDSAFQDMFKLVSINYHKGYSNNNINNNIHENKEAEDSKEDKDKNNDSSSASTSIVFSKIKAEPIILTSPNIVKYKALDKMEESKFPIVITYGDDDIFGTSTKEIFERYPTAIHHIIEKSGHYPWDHNPIVFDKIFNDFYFPSK